MYSLTSGTTGVYNATPITTTLPFSAGIAYPATTSGTTISPLSPLSPLTLSNNMNKVQVNHVAIFKIERNDKNEITSAKFIKEMWIETKNGSSVDFEVAKDPEISKYKADEITIRTIYTVTF
jgi:hypothetical protein